MFLGPSINNKCKKTEKSIYCGLKEVTYYYLRKNFMIMIMIIIIVKFGSNTSWFFSLRIKY